MQESKDFYTDLAHSVGLTLISASVVGVVAEVFIMSLFTKKVLKLEESFLNRVIPSIINTTHEWIISKSKTIPIDKTALYNLIRIGVLQWFMKENFEKIGISSNKIAELYQDLQLSEFKEPIIIDFSTTLRYEGKINEEISGRKGLIDLHTQTQYTAFNSSNSETRYVNTNGTILLHAFDIFGIFPKNEKEKQEFVNSLKLKLSITIDDVKIEYETIPIYLDLKDISRLEEKKPSEIIQIIENKLDTKIKDNTTYLFYSFRGNELDDIKRFIYSAFCTYTIKPQERILVSYDIHESFAENDYLFHTMKSITKGVSVNLIGFEDRFDTTILKYFLNDKEDTIKQTTNILTTSSLMLPKSIIIISWQKKLESL